MNISASLKSGLFLLLTLIGLTMAVVSLLDSQLEKITAIGLFLVGAAFTRYGFTQREQILIAKRNEKTALRNLAILKKNEKIKKNNEMMIKKLKNEIKSLG